MKILVVTDIFGKTKALIELVTELSTTYEEIEIIDPYEGIDQQFTNEDDAYQKFNEICGINKFTNKITAILEKQINSIKIVGFSVGASCLWEIASGENSQKINQAICFYGSRIREKTKKIPHCQTTLIFPKYEASFNVEETIKDIEPRRNIEIIRTNFLHGFMNKHSVNYSATAYDKYMNLIKKTV